MFVSTAVVGAFKANAVISYIVKGVVKDRIARKFYPVNFPNSGTAIGRGVGKLVG